MYMSASSVSPLAQKLIARSPILQSLGGQVQLTQSEEILLDDETKLDLFDVVLDSVPDINKNLNSPLVSTKGVEKAEGKALPTVETPGITYVEQEPSPEIPVEVEGFLQRVDEAADKLSQEIVLADSNLVTQNQSHPAQPVMVLPIKEEAEKEARGKSPKFSIVWLVEWSRKIIKKFLGKVIYRS